MSAAACGPSEEPEASAGWAFATAAAEEHDVWVVTRPRFRTEIEAALEAHPTLARHLVVEYLDLPVAVQRLRRHSWDLYWYYALWQWALGRRVRRLHRRLTFDVAHHVTFANDWLPCGLNRLRSVPIVWGPVGGASSFSYWRMRRWLGLTGFLGEVARSVTTGIPRRLFGDSVARRAAVVVAQNQDVADRFSGARRVVVEPNAALEAPAPEPGAPTTLPAVDGGERTALFVGRLIGWKGARLAVATVAHPAAAGWRLQVYGEGYDRDRLVELAARLGVSDRVHFLGHRPREEVLAAYRTADALLFPSMHDQAGWVAAEASSVGCPVVCLPLGGPPILAGPNAHVAALEGDLVANLARTLVEAGDSDHAAHDRWSRSRLPALVADWYADAVRSHAAPVDSADVQQS